MSLALISQSYLSDSDLDCDLGRGKEEEVQNHEGKHFESAVVIGTGGDSQLQNLKLVKLKMKAGLQDKCKANENPEDLSRQNFVTKIDGLSSPMSASRSKRRRPSVVCGERNGIGHKPLSTGKLKAFGEQKAEDDTGAGSEKKVVKFYKCPFCLLVCSTGNELIQHLAIHMEYRNKANDKVKTICRKAINISKGVKIEIKLEEQESVNFPEKYLKPGRPKGGSSNRISQIKKVKHETNDTQDDSNCSPNKCSKKTQSGRKKNPLFLGARPKQYSTKRGTRFPNETRIHGDSMGANGINQAISNESARGDPKATGNLTVWTEVRPFQLRPCKVALSRCDNLLTSRHMSASNPNCHNDSSRQRLKLQTEDVRKRKSMMSQSLKMKQEESSNSKLPRKKLLRHRENKSKMLVTHAHAKINLRIHTKKKHYQCTICSKAFSSSAILQGHLRTHTGEKPFGCSTCSKEFACKSNLQAHSSIHTGVWRYNCHICSKGFSQRMKLQYHLYLHTGEKPFSCPHCLMGFRQPQPLKRHIRCIHMH